MLIRLRAARSHSDGPYGVSSPNVQTRPGWLCPCWATSPPSLHRDAGVCRKAWEGVVGRTASLPHVGWAGRAATWVTGTRGSAGSHLRLGQPSLAEEPWCPLPRRAPPPPRAVTVRSGGWSLGAAPPALGTAAPCQQRSGRWPGSLVPEPGRSHRPHPGSGASAAGAAGCTLTPAGVGPCVAQPGSHRPACSARPAVRESEVFSSGPPSSH